MTTSINWRLVLRHLLPAIYVPLFTLIGFGILVALTGTASFAHIDEAAFAVATASFVFVFAKLAASDARAAGRNVTALAGICLLVTAGVGVAAGQWRYGGFWIGLGVTGVLFAIAAAIGLRWARRWTTWRNVRGSS